MPRIPTHQRQISKSTNVGAAPQPFVDTDAGAIGRGLANLGQGIGNLGASLFKIEQQKQKMRDDTAMTLAGSSLSKFSTDQFDTARRKEYLNVKEVSDDRDLFASDYDQRVEKIINESNMSSEAAQLFKNQSIALKDSFTRKQEGVWWAKEVGVGQLEARLAVSDEYRDLIQRGATLEELRGSDKVKAIGEGTKDYWKPGQFALEAETQLVSALKIEGTEGNLDAFELAKQVVQTAPSAVFDAEAKLAELKNIENTKKWTENKANRIKNEAHLAIDEDFISKIQTQELKPDDVKNSILDEKTSTSDRRRNEKLTKSEWLDYVANSLRPPPEKSTPSGHSNATDTVMRFSRLELSKEAAYRELLDLRYLDESITDNDFNWAVSKINKPYSPTITPNVEAVTQENRAAIASEGFLWGAITTDAEEERARMVNTDLIAWVDSEISQGREPTKEQMNDYSAQLRAGTVDRTTSTIHTPITQEDYNRLPVGASFIDPKTGEQFTKEK